MGLSEVLFKEQMESLTVFYPNDKVDISDKMLKGWWPVFKNFEDVDFLNGVIACRLSSRRFPTAGILETSVRDVAEKRSREDYDVRMKDHDRMKREESNYFKQSYDPKDEGSYTKAQSSACFRAIMVSLSEGKEAGIKAMQAVAEKYPSNKTGIMVCADEIGKWEGR